MKPLPPTAKILSYLGSAHRHLSGEPHRKTNDSNFDPKFWYLKFWSLSRKYGRLDRFDGKDTSLRRNSEQKLRDAKMINEAVVLVIVALLVTV